MVDPWSEFVADFHQHDTSDPNECVGLGVERRLDDLPDPSLSERDRRVASARALIDRARDLRAAETDFDRALDLDLATQWLASGLHLDTVTFNGRPDAEQRPQACRDIGSGIHQMLLNDPRPAAERLSNITSRIEKVPRYLAALLDRLDHPVERWVRIDQDEVAGLPGLFAVLRDWAKHEQWPDRNRLEKSIEVATSALGAYARRLASMPTEPGIHIGAEATQQLLVHRGLELGLADLHRIATDFLDRTLAEIDELRRVLVKRHGLEATTDADGLQAFFNQRYAVSGDGDAVARVLAHYEAERQRIDAFIAERDLFPIPPDQSMKIIRTPDFLIATLPAGAMQAPPPFRSGTRTSIVYLTLTDALVGHHNELEIPGMMIHEGIPGHHLQLAWAAGHPSIVRRHVWAADMGEGWTTMLEDYMTDEGYYGDLTDEARFCAKRGIARLGARVAIDLFFMTGDRSYLDVGVGCDTDAADPFDAAGNLLAAVTGFPAERVEGELNWYSKSRGIPLSYLAGNHLVWALKGEIVDHARATGSPEGHDLDRRFHRVYLENGNMPVSMLRRVFEQEGMLSGVPG